MHNLIKFLIGHRVSSYKNSWCDEYYFGLEHISNPILLLALICQHRHKYHGFSTCWEPIDLCSTKSLLKTIGCFICRAFTRKLDLCILGFYQKCLHGYVILPCLIFISLGQCFLNVLGKNNHKNLWMCLDVNLNPRVLLTHIPLYRPDWTTCGPYRYSPVINQVLFGSALTETLKAYSP